MLYRDTETFMRAAQKALTKLAVMPHDMTNKREYPRPDKSELLGNAQALLAMANAVAAAASTIVHQLDPPSEGEVHYHQPVTPLILSGGAAESVKAA